MGWWSGDGIWFTVYFPLLFACSGNTTPGWWCCGAVTADMGSVVGTPCFVLCPLIGEGSSLMSISSSSGHTRQEEDFLCHEMGWEADVTFKNIINTLDSTYTWVLFGVTARCVLEAGQLDWILSWVQENPRPTLIKSTVPCCRINVKVNHDQVWGCHANSHCHLLRDKCLATEYTVFMSVHGITENKTIHFSFLTFPNVLAA